MSFGNSVNDLFRVPTVPALQWEVQLLVALHQ